MVCWKVNCNQMITAGTVYCVAENKEGTCSFLSNLSTDQDEICAARGGVGGGGEMPDL